MTAPRIAITCGFDEAKTRATHVGLDYTAAIEEAGGLPLVIPVPYRVRQARSQEAATAARCLAAEVLASVDGVLVTGGGDVDPEYFGEAPIPGLGLLEPARDVFEMALVRATLAHATPIMGVCRGVQLLAIAAGGSLYQDLGSQKEHVLKHRQLAPRNALTHFVDVRPGTLVASRLGQGLIRVNSFHHQAISRLPEGFVVSATAPDGVIEAIESVGAMSGQGGFAFGVQWHPENLWEQERVFLSLFVGLVEAAARRRRGE